MSANSYTKEQREALDELVKNAQKEMTDESRRYLDITRIPLICYSIVDIKKSMEEIRELMRERNNDHENRIRALEGAMWRWMGVAAMVAPIVATIVTIFITKTID